MTVIVGCTTVMAIVEHYRRSGSVQTVAAIASSKPGTGWSIVGDINVMVTLVALFCANAGISCLETTFGIFMEHGTTEP